MMQNLQIHRNLGAGGQIQNIFSAIFIFFVFLISQNSYSVELKQRQFGVGAHSSGGFVAEVPGTESMTEMDVVSTLRHDIQLLDEEIMKCDRKRKGWVAATVVGGVGVVGTGIGAIVQHNKIQNKKSELKQVQSDIADTKQSIKDASNPLQEVSK